MLRSECPGDGPCLQGNSLLRGDTEVVPFLSKFGFSVCKTQRLTESTKVSSIYFLNKGARPSKMFFSTSS